MKIKAVEVVRHCGAMRESFAGARGEWRVRAGLILVLRDEEGRIGLGEASPLPGYSTETIEACARSLAIAPADLSDLDLDLPLLPQLSSSVASGRAASLGEPPEWGSSSIARRSRSWPVTVIASPAARFALQTAVLDLAAQRLGVSMKALIGDPPGRERGLELAAVISGSSVEALERSANEALARGVRTLKIKIGREPFAAELIRLRAVARILSSGVRLRLDANQRLVPDTEARLSALSELAPELVEEPAPPEALLELRYSPVPLALDESLMRSDAVELVAALASRGLLSTLVLKPMAIGGLLRGVELAYLARALGLLTVVSHLVDGPVAHAAASQFAFATSSNELAVGLDRHPGLSAWPELPLPHLRRDRIEPIRAPGLLGIDASASEAWLKRLSSHA